MMRASWVGAIHFGLVSIPVRLWQAARRHRPRLHYLHRECRTPLTTQRYCPFHEEVVPWEEVVRGFEVAPGQFVVVEADELAEAQTGPAHSRRIDIQAFVDLGEIDPIYFDASYYAEPLTEGRPAYALLQQAMRQTARAAIARLAFRQRERLAALWPWENALIVHTLYFADEVRSPATLDLPTEEADPRELRTAIRLIEAMAERFTPRRLQDEYHRRLMTIIEQKAEAEVAQPVAEGTEARPELLGELQASISAVQQSRRPHP